MIVDSDQSWPTDLTTAGPYSLVQVKNGATLTIEPGYEVLFCPTGILDIEDKGRVDLNGSLSSYSTEWRGVRMTGDSEFYGHDNAKVSNAREAILSSPPSSVKINCTGMEFINNRISVMVFNSTNLLAFRKCNFVVNSDYSITSRSQPHVFISNLRAYFGGCNFENSSAGILALNCKLNVKDYCEGIQPYPCPGQYLIPSSFTHLPIGVLVSGTNNASNARVANAKFNDCLFGIVDIGQSGSSFYGNTFQLGHPDFPASLYSSSLFSNIFGVDGQVVQVGISYLGGINGINCVNNKFYGDPDVSEHTVGIHVKDIGSFENLIEGNHFDGLTRANVAENKNADGKKWA